MENIRIRDLLEKKDDVFVSIYLPTHRTSPDNKQDKIRFNNLLNKASKELEEKYEKVKPQEFLKEARKIHDDLNFWNYGTEGLAVLVDSEQTRVIRFTGDVPELVVVGSQFHILPLINYYELPNDYYLLDISRDRFKIYELSSESMEELDTPEIHEHFSDLFDDRDLENRVVSTGGSETSFHGHKAKPEIDEKETEKYFRYLSKELGNFFKAKGNPIILFGTTENVADFKEISKDDLNIFASIDKPLDSMDDKGTIDALRQKLLPRYVDTVKGRLDGLNTEISRDMGTDNASRIVTDAPTGRIETLFISTKYDKLEVEEIDKLIAEVINGGGEVVLVDVNETQFPMEMGAKYRF
ncbi:MAG: hypothetical protein GX666_00855 [Tissierellia bacterium]|nr:hypothetical protein [Tissierellia bacterium]